MKELLHHTKSSINRSIAFLLVLTSFTGRMEGRSIAVDVTDRDTGEAVEFAAVAVTRGERNVGGLTDISGRYAFTLPAGGGAWHLSVTAVGYKPYASEMKVSSGDSLQIVKVVLVPAYTQIGEVVVTAREGRGLASASLIDRQTMEPACTASECGAGACGAAVCARSRGQTPLVRRHTYAGMRRIRLHPFACVS